MPTLRAKSAIEISDCCNSRTRSWISDVSAIPEFDGSYRFEMHGSWVPSVHLLVPSTPVVHPSCDTKPECAGEAP
jgi:hypothetical protein